MIKARIFRLHYNRFGAKDGSVWTVHLSDKCIPTMKVKVEVPVETIFKGLEASQPRAFLKGKGRVFVYKNEVRIIQ